MDSPETIPATTQGAVVAPAPGSGAFSSPPATPSPEPYKFPPRPLFSAAELRRLNADYSALTAKLSRRFAALFRTDFDLTIDSLQTPAFRQFVAGSASPTHFTLFKIEPLRGIGVLESSPAFALAATDRLMGGPGTCEQANRELTEIEVALYDQVVQLFLQGWCEHWSGWKELRPVLLGHESDPHYLQTTAADAAMFAVTFDAKLGDNACKLRFVLPLTAVEPLMEKLRAELQPAADAAPSALPAKPANWNPALNEVRVAITARMPGPLITARELPKLKVGDMLDLPVASASQVQLHLGNSARFTGRLGKCDDKWAVEITQVLTL